MKIFIAVFINFVALTVAVSYTGGNYYPTRSNTYYSGDSNKGQVLRNDKEMKADGSYHYEYETSNGISGSEQGVGGIAVSGASSYTSPEGVAIKLTYTADENGYHPVGDHIPKTPDYILRALEYIRTHPYQINDYYTGKTSRPSGQISQQISTNFAVPPHRPSKPKRLTPPLF